MVFGLSRYRHESGGLPRKQRPVSAMGRDTGMGFGLQTVGASGDRLVLQVRQEGQEIRERPAGHGGLPTGRHGLRPPTGQHVSGRAWIVSAREWSELRPFHKPPPYFGPPIHTGTKQ